MDELKALIADKISNGDYFTAPAVTHRDATKFVEILVEDGKDNTIRVLVERDGPTFLNAVRA